MNRESQRKILIVEDDQDIRETLAEVLELENIQVGRAGNGKEGLEWIKTQQSLPSVILLDLFMPEMDGREFHKELRRISGSAPHSIQPSPHVIVLSAAPKENELVQAILPGVSAFLRKPIELDLLLDTIQKFCPDVRQSPTEKSSDLV